MRATFIERFEQQYVPEPNSGCWLWTGAVSNPDKPYGRVFLNGRNLAAHRAAYMVFVGPIPDGHCVMHKCDNPACVNPMHLRTGTIIENNQDMTDKGRRATGERNGTSKLTRDQVTAIRSVYIKRSKIFGVAALAKVYGVCETNVRSIVKNRLWRDAS